MASIKPFNNVFYPFLANFKWGILCQGTCEQNFFGRYTVQIGLVNEKLFSLAGLLNEVEQ